MDNFGITTSQGIPWSNHVVACQSVSVPFLLLGALVQSIFCRRGSALHTLLFLGFLSLSIMLGSWLGFGGFFIPLVCWGFWRFSHLVRRPEPINKETPEQIECLDCHATIPVGESSCLKCGWTFKI
jgi:hypothetical protein